MATAAAAFAPPRLVDKKGSKCRVWKYFGFEADDRGVIINPQKPLCNRCYCCLQTKGGNTSNLAKHLKDCHPDLFKEFKGVKAGSVEEPQEEDSTVVKKEPTVKTREGDDASAGKNGQEETVWRGVYSPQDLYTFPATRVGETNTLKVSIRNNSSSTHELKFVNTKEPFYIKHSKYSLRSQHYLKLPIQFRPSTAGRHASLLLIKSETSESLVIQLIGEAMP